MGDSQMLYTYVNNNNNRSKMGDSQMLYTYVNNNNNRYYVLAYLLRNFYTLVTFNKMYY